MLISVHADNFFSHIRVRIHILTICRHLQGQLISVDCRSKVQILHNSQNVLLGNLNTQDIVHLSETDLHLPGLYGIAGIDIHMSPGDLTATKFLHQVKGTLHCMNGCVFIHALLISRAGICTLSETSGGFSDVVSCKLCRLKHNSSRSVTDFGIQSAHNAGKGNGLDAVTNHEIVGGQRILLGIQGHNLFPFPGTSDFDFIALQIIAVKGVHGLSHFQHNIVCDIYDI